MTPIPSPIPNPPFANIANVVPPPPQDPPTIDDVIRAKVYAQRALVAELYPDQIDDATIAGALVYQDSILAASSAGAAAPPWFGDAMKQALEPIEKALDDVKQRCRQLNTRLNDIDARFDTNALVNDFYDTELQPHVRRWTPFVAVPFPDGKLPADDLTTPTPLTDANIILQLHHDELQAYCDGYYPQQGYGNGQRQPTTEALCQAIGCAPV
ncbi:hypothetical protein B0H16DRAFT_1852004 [Mycena metata]|uniref:Mug135-like C-terminal domain-containing protein n=1 Tax=Mycena metata TaxID=1033252 RepID=A0AAD7IN82_9AGAR|nr:hypothetical protein B0H16DRAFT_1852004 [Mycena metata]